MSPQALSYAKAGVNVDRANALARGIGRMAKVTKGKGTLGDIGGFSGFFDPSFMKIKNPLLVGSTDGVGTKLELAQFTKRHATVGIDLVAMCVNDLICTGARPAFFLDYFACGKLDNKIASEVLKGIVKGCQQAESALIGGETAEMPGFYPGKKYDLAGFAVGIVDRKKVVDGKKMRAGHVIIGLGSSGFHSNGYSLLRKVYSSKELRGTKGKQLLKPTAIYVKPIMELVSKLKVSGIAHITGGAYYDKIPRIIPKGLCAEIDVLSWPLGAPFKEVMQRGKIAATEMYRTFNMGIGMIVVLPATEAAAAMRLLKKQRVKAYSIGNIVRTAPRAKKVKLLNLETLKDLKGSAR